MKELREIQAKRAELSERRVTAEDQLRRIDDQRCERLVLVAHSARLAAGDLGGLDDLGNAIGVIAGLIGEVS